MENELFTQYEKEADCVIYTDGSYNYKTKMCYSAFIVIKDKEIIHKKIFIFDDKSGQTNNTAERRAIKEALEYAKKRNIVVNICTDSSVAFNAYKHIAFDNLKHIFKVEGHKNDFYNKYVDKYIRNSFYR